jgi:hypothetical protein
METDEVRIGAKQYKRKIAIAIAIESDVLARCGHHQQVVIETGINYVESAQKLASEKLSNGHLKGIFEDRRDMASTIKEVVEEADMNCALCQGTRD